MPVAVSKWCSYIVAPLYRLCVPSGFGGRAEFGENTSHVFHSECEEMVGVGLEEEGLHLEMWVRVRSQLLEQKP